MNLKDTFRKILTLNDTGETGGHMGGIHVPKEYRKFFADLDASVKNPRQEIIAVDQTNRIWRFNYIYYNSALFDGTRNEYRLTGLTDYFKQCELVAGDTLIFGKRGDDSYSISFEKSRRESSSISESINRDESLVFGESEGPKEEREHSMRPAARIIHTIGENLIKDPEAAVIEMIKNSYDADARNVYVIFRRTVSSKGVRQMRITVKDDGHGMTYSKVVSAWLVPATSDKVTRRTSPSGRPLQGNKGIGRFAAFMLGSEIYVETKAQESSLKTSLLLQASDFEKMEFLDQVRIIVETREAVAREAAGAMFEMTAYDGEKSFREWEHEDFQKLNADLRRMLFPFRTRDDDFKVWVQYEGFEDFNQIDGIEEVEPLPLLDFFDYRIRVDVDEAGFVSGVFSSPLVPGKEDEIISFEIPELRGKSCGIVSIDLRVIDREPMALDSLLKRSSLAEDPLSTLGKAQLKRLLNEVCGISVFRGDFRIRPYGDIGNDWLGLDRQRVNNPSFNVGNNQVFGTVVIESETRSNLQEKSARDGLREDEHYVRLHSIVDYIIQELQRRRYEIRRAVGRILKSSKVADLISSLTDFQKPFQKIERLLNSEGVSSEKVDEIRNILKEDSEDRKDSVEKLEQKIAIYQGQATLGKMVGILLHEGNRSIGILRNESRRVPGWIQRKSKSEESSIDSAVIRGLEGISSAADVLRDLFNSIQPLGVRHRGAQREFPLVKSIKVATAALSSKIESTGIEIIINVPEGYNIVAWQQDIDSIFLNLVENSIHWLSNDKTHLPKIEFNLESDEDGDTLEIFDNGPGIPLEHIESEAIFEPAFSLKGGWGLGLPIAGECAVRNGFELHAIYSDSGAHFNLELKSLNIN